MNKYIAYMGQGYCEAFESDSFLQAVARGKQMANDNGKTVRLMELLAELRPDKRAQPAQSELTASMRRIERVLEEVK